MLAPLRNYLADDRRALLLAAAALVLGAIALIRGAEPAAAPAERAMAVVFHAGLFALLGLGLTRPDLRQRPAVSAALGAGILACAGLLLRDFGLI